MVLFSNLYLYKRVRESRRMCRACRRSSLVDSVLTFSSGYDTLEYSWVKATAVSVRLPGNGSYIIFGLSRPRLFFYFFYFYLNPRYPWSSYPSHSSLPQGASSQSHHHLPHLAMN